MNYGIFCEENDLSELIQFMNGSLKEGKEIYNTDISDLERGN